MSDETKGWSSDSISDGVPVRTYEADPARGEAPDPETDQFKYDTPYDGGSTADRAGIEAAKEGKLVSDKDDLERAKEKEKRELGD